MSLDRDLERDVSRRSARHGGRHTGRHAAGGDDPDAPRDIEQEESRRNAALAVGLAVVAVLVVGLLYWLISSFRGPQLAVGAAAAKPTSTTTTAPAAPAPAAASASIPTIGTWTATSTFSLPPPEQPTVTATAAAPPPPPATTAAPPPALAVTNVKLTCKKDEGGHKTSGALSFTTNQKVSAAISAGGQVESKAGGPGDVSLSASGRGPGICFGKIGDQVVGPIPAT